MSEELKTLIRLIQLNGKDFKYASDKFLRSYKEPIDEDINHVQAQMLGWCLLLHEQTGSILSHYEHLPKNPVFQEMVKTAYNYHFPEEKKEKEGPLVQKGKRKMF